MAESLGDFAIRAEELADLRVANARLQVQLRKAKAKNEQLVEAAYEGARDAMLTLGPLQPIKPPKLVKAAAGTPEVAMWIMGDWQLGKRTVDYNSQVARDRVIRFAEKAAKITRMQRSARPIDHCVVTFGGDMVEGACFQFPTQPFEIDSTIFDQYIATSRLLADVVRMALATYSTVEVIAEWGNHGRIGSKRDSLPRSDNVDRMCFALAREILGPQDRLVWEDGEDDIQRIEIGNYRALLIHGDEIGRGGFASPMTIVRHADRWASGAYPWDFTDVLIHHYHQHQEWGMANGKGHVYMTGSTESSNRYARDTMAASAEPSQRLHFIDSERGRVTSSYQIYVGDE